MRQFILPAALALVVISCGGGDEAATSGSSDLHAAASDPGADHAGGSAATSGAVKPWSASNGTAHVTGTIKFTGDRPKVRKVDMGSDATCMATHTDAPMDETVIISAGGDLKNVFVYVKKGLEGWSFTTPSEPVVLSQQGCTYVPHMVGVQVGQMLKIENADDVTHNIHSFSKRNSTFNKSQGKGGSDIEVTFNKSEILIPIKCDIHGWMSTYVGVTENPFFSISGADGSFDLGKLAPGTYTIEARHEVLGKHKQEITVGDGESKSIEFTFSE